MRIMSLKRSDLSQLVKQLASDQFAVVAPSLREDLLAFYRVKSVDEIHFDHINTKLSLKEWFLPRWEAVCSFRTKKKDVELQDAPETGEEIVLFGARPCDAASLPIMDKVYAWDYQDRFWQDRRERTTLVSISCLDCDEACFCTSVGGHPGSTEGSDILLTPVGDDKFLVEVITEKGEALVKRCAELFQEGTADKEAALRAVVEKLGKKFEHARIKPWLDDNFFHPFWEKNTLHCIGCGTCTFVCPTCHCFDIIDEGDFFRGKRVKNWDACQFRTFTVHASGHNPRPRQDERHRQRIMHKYKYYVEKFGVTLCTGCGRCVRYCPVDLSIIGLLQSIDRRKASAA
jgi:ferredoxin